ncbi:peptide chain release factor H [Undibacterium sp.]|uniref:peptide chain release factor H n=1 Tax=Undibacterium sp. TaxID=1914977 RepID=UPI00374CF9FA
MVMLQISAGTGPAECCLAVQKALARFQKEARAAGLDVELLEQVDGPVPGTLRSVLLGLHSGSMQATASATTSLAAQALAQRWCGSILWICDSPYRASHPRKNWFLGCAVYVTAPPLPDSEIRFESTRASGPGGQHVNKTDSAIRATHVATGLSVKVQTERSQHANKRLAAQLLASKLADLAQTEEGRVRAERHQHHRQTERGNARLVFTGPDFKEKI